MPLPPLIELGTEDEYRKKFESIYCRNTITTFDSIIVRFRKNNFDHCFYATDRRTREKTVFDPIRAKRILWIKSALEDSNAKLFVGWDSKSKRTDYKRRVCVISGIAK